MKGMMRKAGRKLEEFDAAYAKKIADMYMEDGKEYGQLGGATRALGMSLLGGVPISARKLEGKDRAPNAILALNAGVRYGAPLAGAGLALKGALDLLNAGSNQTSGTIMPD